MRPTTKSRSTQNAGTAYAFVFISFFCRGKGKKSPVQRKSKKAKVAEVKVSESKRRQELIELFRWGTHVSSYVYHIVAGYYLYCGSTEAPR